MDNICRIGESYPPQDKSYGEFDTLGFNTARGMFISTIEYILPPLTIGLYGSWGSGKTLMINGLVEQLQKDNYLTLIFDAWKYRHEKNLILPLLCAMQREYLSKSDDTKDSVKKVVTSAVVATMVGLLRRSAGIEIGDIKLALETHENEYKFYKKYDDQIAKVEQEYKDFIEQLLKKTQKDKLVIFVDNLDRCLPDVVVNLLEDISTFLSIRNVPCIYVLAMDRDNVINAIKHRFPDFDGAHYLEKIVQVPLKMPALRQSANRKDSVARYHFMKRYEWGKMQKEISSEGDPRDKIYKELAHIDNVFNGDLLGNPRRIERIINKLMLLEATKVFNPESDSTNVPVLVFLLLLAEYFPAIYDSLNTNIDFQVLRDYLQISDQPRTSPSNKRKEREASPPSSVIRNETIYDAYCDDKKFSIFLKGFSKLSDISDLQGRLLKIKDSLNYIG